MKLFGYHRSSAAFRVRIALNLKGMQVDHRFVHLRKGEQSSPEYGALNPQGLVPLVIDGPNVLTQSLAIIEYLEETQPVPSLGGRGTDSTGTVADPGCRVRYLLPRRYADAGRRLPGSAGLQRRAGRY